MSQAQAGHNLLSQSVSNTLKEYYVDSGRLRKMEYAADKTMVRSARSVAGSDHEFSVSGKFSVIAVQLDRQNTDSKDFATSQDLAKKESDINQVWKVPMDKRLVVTRVDHETVLATRDKEGAFIKALMNASDRSTEGVLLSRSADFWGDGTGCIGEIRATKDSGDKTGIQLKSRYTMSKVAIGKHIDIYSAAGVLKEADVRIENVDRSTAVVTLEKVVANLAATDKIYPKNEFGKKHFSGVPTYLTEITDANKLLHGIDRSVNKQRWGGVHMEGGDGYEKTLEALIDAPAEIQVQTGITPMLDQYVMNSVRLTKFINSLGDKIRYNRSQVNHTIEKVGEVGFNAVYILSCQDKQIPLIGSPWVDPNKIYGMDMDTWKRLYLTKEIVNYDSLDGIGVLRSPDDDSLEIRGYSYMNAVCVTPGSNCVIDLSDNPLPEPAALA